jgi:hypothetical protein
MRPPGVMIGDASSVDLPGLVEIKEHALIEQLVAHSPGEGFDIAVLHRLPGSDVVPLDPMLFAPVQDCLRGELGAIAGHDHPRLATPLDDGGEFAGSRSPEIEVSEIAEGSSMRCPEPRTLSCRVLLASRRRSAMIARDEQAISDHRRSGLYRIGRGAPSDRRDRAPRLRGRQAHLRRQSSVAGAGSRQSAL